MSTALTATDGRRPPPAGPERRVLDFDVRGALGVRLWDAPAGAAAAVRRQLGGPAERLGREPDVRLRFVRRLDRREVAWLRTHGSGFTPDGSFVLGAGGGEGGMRVPFDALGGPCEVVCEDGAPFVPFLLEALKLAALRKGILPLHASAFEYEGRGVLVTGWAHGGKTSALLSFARQGARYVGDDLVFMRDGQAFGLPAPIELAARHVADLPEGLGGPRPGERLRVGFCRWLERTGARLAAGAPAPGRRRWLARRLAAARHAGSIERLPEELFGGRVSASCEPRVVFLVLSREEAEVRIDPLEPRDLTDRLAAALRAEELPLFGHYLGYRFAFPGRRNAFLEEVHELRRDLLHAALDGIDAYVVRHPRSGPPAALFRAMEPYCEPSGAAARPAAGSLP